jgi:hypothetical protein
MSKPLICLLGWHKWARRTNDDNQPYRACARCGKIEDDYHPPGSGLDVG